MAKTPIRNLQYLKQKDPKLGEALQDTVNAIDSVALQTAVSPQGVVDPPPDVARVTVVAQDGIFDMRIFDNGTVTRGITYFIEYSTAPNFVSPVPIDLGASRCHRAFLGNLTLYFRAFSQYIGSLPSSPVYFGSTATPTPVTGGGSLAGPSPQLSTGSGTGPSDGTASGQGHGITLKRT